jgi:hypothetical protein
VKKFSEPVFIDDHKKVNLPTLIILLNAACSERDAQGLSRLARTRDIFKGAPLRLPEA